MGVDGEIEQLREYVGPFSARAAQVTRNLEHFETAWRADHPGEEPGPALQRAWATLAWAKDRPDKVTAVAAETLNRRWLDELAALGYRPPDGTVPLGAVRAGDLDRDALAETVLSRLAAGRSAWNGADIRGEAEQALARTGLIADAAVRIEIAEDVTARGVALSVPLVSQAGVPEHLRTLTSARVIEVEADLTSRIVARSNGPDPGHADLDLSDLDALARLDAGQRDAVSLLAGDRQLVLIEGAAGAGKTSVLVATREALEWRGHRLSVVTPTLKAARVAADQLGSQAGSAAWLTYQYGFRWDDDGHWTRLDPGEADPATGATYPGPNGQARLRPGDLLLVDEAGMLDQDTARALFTVADEHHVRVALVGDRRQLPAVGRGGVLDLAARWADPEAHLTLTAVHRFTDPDYADLTLRIRAGQDPAAVFDELVARGLVRIHSDEHDRTAVVADETAQAAAAGRVIAVATDTRAQVADLNTAVRERLVTAGRVNDSHAVTTGAGERVGVGDRVATRRNDPGLGVANRDTWTVTATHSDGGLTVTGAQESTTLPSAYVFEHVELAYASTEYGVQGDTTDSAHVLVGEHTTGQAAYVGMTRGRDSNIAHLVAHSVDEAREQWVAVFDRQRADLGPSHAAGAAAVEAARYAEHRPLPEVLRELRAAWGREEHLLDALAIFERRHDRFLADIAGYERLWQVMPALAQDRDRTAVNAREARQVLQDVTGRVEQDADRIADTLRQRWRVQRPDARQAARTMRDGEGLLHLRHHRVQTARAHLDEWAAAWQPVVSDLTSGGYPRWTADGWDDPIRVRDALARYAHTLAVTAHPDYGFAQQQADRADADAAATQRGYDAARRQTLLNRIDSAETLHHEQTRDHTEQQAAEKVRAALDQVRGEIDTLTGEPGIRTLRPGQLDLERDLWHAERALDGNYAQQITRAAATVSHEPAAVRAPAPEPGISL